MSKLQLFIFIKKLINLGLFIKREFTIAGCVIQIQ